MANVLLEVRGLSRRFGGLAAVSDVTFAVPGGAIQALIGPNGAGKTTLFNLIAGSLAPDAGKVFMGGEDITGARPHVVAGHGIARTFQTTRLFAHMTVLENVMVGRHLRSSAGFAAALLHLPRTGREEREILEKSREILGSLGLLPHAREQAGNLPFGLQRTVELARAMAAEPRLLLLDEPAAGLNMHETAELAALIQRIRGMGITVLVVEHDMALVMDISDTVVVLSEGRVLAEDVPAAIQRHPDVIRIYLGEDGDA